MKKNIKKYILEFVVFFVGVTLVKYAVSKFDADFVYIMYWSFIFAVFCVFLSILFDWAKVKLNQK
ncbi:hypothetical protein [Ornithobacterium rhinotracheale]